MQQLTGIDNSFLSMETAKQFGHVASLTIYDLTDWSGRNGETSFYESIMNTVAERIHLLPFMRRKLVSVPLGLDHPYWINDTDFDLEFHVRNLGLPAPGTDEQLSEQVARLAARPLDRARPLWELYIIDGLSGNRSAMFTKIHHATIDGVQGVEVLTTLLDTDPQGRQIPPPRGRFRGEQAPSTAELMTRTAVTYSMHPFRAAKILTEAVQSSSGLAKSATAELTRVAVRPLMGLPIIGKLAKNLSELRGDAEQFPLLNARPAPKTPFNRSITSHRRYAFTSLSLADAKLVKSTFGTTINDVVLAISSAALRKYLLESDALPSESLVAMVPVSVRSGSEKDAYSNQVSAMLAQLASNIADPLERLKAINASMKEAKGMAEAIPANLLTDLSQFAPPALAARASRLMTRTGVVNRINPPFNLIISNVPGPTQQLYTSGARLDHFYPVSTIIDGQGMNITVQSYRGFLDFGVISCRELVPDPTIITTYLGEALAELVTLVGVQTSQAAPAPTRVAPKAKRPSSRKSSAK
jgi:diacylglycerol O-acyltransferase / wax synthase